jgi:hypothetical protein
MYIRISYAYLTLILLIIIALLSVRITHPSDGISNDYVSEATDNSKTALLVTSRTLLSSFKLK